MCVCVCVCVQKCQNFKYEWRSKSIISTIVVSPTLYVNPGDWFTFDNKAKEKVQSAFSKFLFSCHTHTFFLCQQY